MSKVIDLIGQKFGYWNVLERDLSKKGAAYWICQCQCGTIRSVCGSSLRNGTSTSCGCYRTENSRTNNGTYINDEKVAGIRKIKSGDVLEIGEMRFYLSIVKEQNG